MYKKNSLNLFVNTESDNISSDYDLLKKLQKDIKQNTDSNFKNTDPSPTSTDIMSIQNNLSTTSDDSKQVKKTSDDSKQVKKTSISNVLKPYVNTKSNSVTSSDNFNLKNSNLSTTSDDIKLFDFIKQEKRSSISNVLKPKSDSVTSSDNFNLKNNNLSTTSDDITNNFIKQNKKSSISNVLKPKSNSVTSSDNFNLKNSNLSTTSISVNNKKKKDYLINETSEYMPLEINLINETSEYMPLEVNLNYILEQNNNSNNNQKVPSNNNNEKTINLTNIFNGIVGLFTYLFTIDNKSNNDNDNDNDII